jgi:hypothetical protein
MYIVYVNTNMEEEMKKLKDLGFKKVRGTEPGFVMYELNPAELGARQRIHDNLKAEATSSKPQAPSSKPQATSRKQQALDKSK